MTTHGRASGAAWLAALASLLGCQDPARMPTEGSRPHADLRDDPQVQPMFSGSVSTTIKITDLGALAPLGSMTFAEAINDAAEVAGFSDTGSSIEVFRWSTQTGLQMTGVYGFTHGMNAAGQVTGRRFDSVPERAFVVDKNGGFSELTNALPCCWMSEGNAINDAGYVVGSAYHTGSEPGPPPADDHAFRWHPSTGTVVDLGEGSAGGINNLLQTVGSTMLPNQTVEAWRHDDANGRVVIASNVSPTDISDSGVVVGVKPDAADGTHAFRWTQGSGLKDLGKVGEASAANAVNNKGYVVGSEGDKAMLWKPSGVRVTLPTLEKNGTAVARDVNSALQVVGSSSYGRLYHAVQWDVRIKYYMPSFCCQYHYFPTMHPIKLATDRELDVTVLTTPLLDATTLNPAVLTLGNDIGRDTPILRDASGRPKTVLTDVDRDGRRDLVAYFDVAAMQRNGDLSTSTTQLVLNGDFGDGTTVRATNSVRVVAR